MNFFKKTAHTGEVTEAQVKAWERKYPEGITTIEVDGQKWVFKMPTGKQIKDFVKRGLKGSAELSALKLMETCCIAGNPGLMAGTQSKKQLIDQFSAFCRDKIKKVLPQYAKQFNN